MHMDGDMALLRQMLTLRMLLTPTFSPPPLYPPRLRLYCALSHRATWPQVQRKITTIKWQAIWVVGLLMAVHLGLFILFYVLLAAQQHLVDDLNIMGECLVLLAGCSTVDSQPGSVCQWAGSVVRYEHVCWVMSALTLVFVLRFTLIFTLTLFPAVALLVFARTC